MGFFNIFNKKTEKTEKRSENDVNIQTQTYISPFFGSLQFNGLTSYREGAAMFNSAVFRCVELLSNAVASLPVVVNQVNSKGYKKPKPKHPVYKLLNSKPNQRQTKFTFFKSLIINMLLTGNSYALIKRDEGGQVKELIFIPSDKVTIISKDIFEEVKYQVVGIKQLIPAKDILHFINIPNYEGTYGISTLAYAKRILTLASAEVDAADSFFRSGNSKSGILTSEKPITDSQEQEIIQRWNQTFNGTSGLPNGVCLLKPGLKYESIQANPAEAELLESRKFSVLEVARFFGVSPSMILDNSNNSYSSVEAEMLSFLQNTLNPLLEKIENELNCKLWCDYEDGYAAKFDTSVLLRTNKEGLASYFSTLSGIGVLSPNEIRRQLDLEPIDGGDNHFMQVNISTIGKIAQQEISDSPVASNQLKHNNIGEENEENIKTE
jgi:HK97 family phage portal protein